MNILEDLKKNYKNIPYLDHSRAVLSAPVRHIFMISLLGYLKNLQIDKPKILEIGSWFGASTLSWAQGIEKYHNSKGYIDCVDAWQPFFDLKNHKDKDYVIEMEKLLEKDIVFKIFKHNINTINKSINVNFFREMSNVFFEKCEKKFYDVIFIDADHTYKSVKEDILNSLKFIQEDGIICGDDLNMQYDEIDKDNAKKNHDKDFICDPKTKRNFHPGVTLAVNEIFGQVNSWAGFWAIQKKGSNWQNISLKHIPITYPKHFNKKLLFDATNHFNDIKDRIL